MRVAAASAVAAAAADAVADFVVVVAVAKVAASVAVAPADGALVLCPCRLLRANVAVVVFDDVFRVCMGLRDVSRGRGWKKYGNFF